MWKRVAYVSGQLRGKADSVHGVYTPCILAANTEKAAHYARLLWRAGWATICPHLNTQNMDGLEGLPPEAFIAGDLAFLDRFNELDIIVMIPGWRDSLGAVAEYEHACKLGIDVLLAERFPDDAAFMVEAAKMYRQRQIEAAAWAKQRALPVDLPTDPQVEGGGV